MRLPNGLAESVRQSWANSDECLRRIAGGPDGLGERSAFKPASPERTLITDLVSGTPTRKTKTAALGGQQTSHLQAGDGKGAGGEGKTGIVAVWERRSPGSPKQTVRANRLTQGNRKASPG